MQAVLLIGIQASGKTTFYVERFFHTHVRISLDLLKTRNREQQLLQWCLAARQPFVVDNTNVRIDGRARYIVPAHAAGFRVSGYFFPTPIAEALARNDARTGKQKIPVPGIRGTLKRLEPPQLHEGFDELFIVTVSGPGTFDVRPWPELAAS